MGVAQARRSWLQVSSPLSASGYQPLHSIFRAEAMCCCLMDSLHISSRKTEDVKLPIFFFFRRTATSAADPSTLMLLCSRVHAASLPAKVRRSITGSKKPHCKAWLVSRYGYFFDPARSAPSWLVGTPHKNTRCKWLPGEILAANNNSIGYFIDAVWRLGGLSTNILRQHLPEQGWLHVMHPRTGNGWVSRPWTISPATGGCSHGRRYMAEGAHRTWERQACREIPGSRMRTPSRVIHPMNLMVCESAIQKPKCACQEGVLNCRMQAAVGMYYSLCSRSVRQRAFFAGHATARK